jgi:hypothetical protein
MVAGIQRSQATRQMNTASPSFMTALVVCAGSGAAPWRLKEAIVKKENMNWKITFNMPGKPEMTQSLIISSSTRDEALIDAGYLAKCYELEVLQLDFHEQH